jgi:hypothetical protein
MVWPVVVLAEPDTDAAPRRLRLLCEHEDYRVAVWVDREDLATVVRAPTHLTTRLPAPEPLGPAAPGVHLPAGYLLDAVQDVDGRTQRAAIHGLFFRTELLLHKEQVGVTYREAPTLPPPSHFHGEVTRSASFLDAPGGAVVATVTKPAGSANSLYVTRIQERGDGWTLSRYDDQDAAIIGWVAAGEIRWFDEPVANDSSTGYATGSMGGVHRRLISLSQGTLLRAEATREPIGVVLRTTSFLLTGDSDHAAPVLSLSACGGPVRVRPDGPRP